MSMTTTTQSATAATMTARGVILTALSVSSESKYLMSPADWEKPPPSFFLAMDYGFWIPYKKLVGIATRIASP